MSLSTSFTSAAEGRHSFDHSLENLVAKLKSVLRDPASLPRHPLD